MNVALDVTVNIWQEGRQYIAHALPVDVMSSGATPEDARRALDEAVRCFLGTLHEQGTLEQVLEECGYEKRGGNWTGPNWIGVKRQTLGMAV